MKKAQSPKFKKINNHHFQIGLSVLTLKSESNANNKQKHDSPFTNKQLQLMAFFHFLFNNLNKFINWTLKDIERFLGITNIYERINTINNNWGHVIGYLKFEKQGDSKGQIISTWDIRGKSKDFVSFNWNDLKNFTNDQLIIKNGLDVAVQNQFYKQHGFLAGLNNNYSNLVYGENGLIKKYGYKISRTTYFKIIKRFISNSWIIIKEKLWARRRKTFNWLRPMIDSIKRVTVEFEPPQLLENEIIYQNDEDIGWYCPDNDFCLEQSTCEHQ